MSISLAHTQAVDSRQRNSRARRSHLRILGVDHGLIAATPDADLLDLYPPTSTRLVTEAELYAEYDRSALECAPKRAKFFDDHDSETPDEAESTRIGIATLNGERVEMLPYIWSGGTHFMSGAAVGFDDDPTAA